MRGSVEVALPTDADSIEERRLEPFEVRRVTLPPGVIAARATLHVRAFRQDALLALGIDATQVPVIDVASAGL